MVRIELKKSDYLVIRYFSKTSQWYKFLEKLTNFFQFIDGTGDLPDGTYPMLLSQATQERFECVAEWDLSILEPQKIVSLDKIKEDLKREESDFTSLKDHIKVSKYSKFLFLEFFYIFSGRYVPSYFYLSLICSNANWTRCSLL